MPNVLTNAATLKRDTNTAIDTIMEPQILKALTSIDAHAHNEAAQGRSQIKWQYDAIATSEFMAGLEAALADGGFTLKEIPGQALGVGLAGGQFIVSWEDAVPAEPDGAVPEEAPGNPNPEPPTP